MTRSLPPASVGRGNGIALMAATSVTKIGGGQPSSGGMVLPHAVAVEIQLPEVVLSGHRTLIGGEAIPLQCFT